MAATHPHLTVKRGENPMLRTGMVSAVLYLPLILNRGKPEQYELLIDSRNFLDRLETRRS